MKMHLRTFIGGVCLGVALFSAHSDASAEFIEQVSTGYINWTQGLAVATGTSDGSIPSTTSRIEPGTTVEQAVQLATDNLILTLAHLRMNHQSCLSDLLYTQASAQAKVNEMAAAAKIINTTALPHGGASVVMEMSLRGGFAQLVLPSEIRQVEPIKALYGDSAVYDDAQNITKPEGYTGLLVDARGVGARPSMVPILLDENQEEVYGPAYVSREFAVQKGMCRYVSDVDNISDLAQVGVGPKPLLVKGLRAVANESCHIVISNADASKLRSASSHLEFLKQCRVVIILD